MAIFEKAGYWGLKDPLEVRVQHETCIYMGDTFSSHFEPKKIDWVGRRGQKQPKLAYICTFKNTQIFELLKPFLESLHQTVFFGWNQYIGTLILALSAFPRSVLWEVNTGPDLEIDLGPLTV